MTSSKSKKWLAEAACDDDPYCQVTPINDEQEHVHHGIECWCDPTVHYQDADTGAILNYPQVVHNSADMREVVEEAESFMVAFPRSNNI